MSILSLLAKGESQPENQKKDRHKLAINFLPARIQHLQNTDPVCNIRQKSAYEVEV